MTISRMRLWLQNDGAGAIEANEQGTRVGRSVDRGRPNQCRLPPPPRPDLPSLAASYRKRSDKRGALEYFRKAAALGEELLAADPANALTRKDLAYHA